jgi:hypothetical protein
LLPTIIEISLWAEKYYPIAAERKAMLSVVKKNRAGYIKSMTKAWENL